jgi:hypothetical protein
MWANFARGKVFTAGNTTTNRIESNWNQVKMLLSDVTYIQRNRVSKGIRFPSAGNRLRRQLLQGRLPKLGYYNLLHSNDLQAQRSLQQRP